MSLSVDGFWESGFWSQTFWADGFWFEGEYVPPVVVDEPRRGGGGISKGKSRYKKEKVWLVTIDEEEIEVDDLEEIQEVVVEKIAKGKTPKVRAKPQVDTVQKVAEAYAAQPQMTQFVPIPIRRFEFVDVLPYILALQQAEEDEELLLLLS